MEKYLDLWIADLLGVKELSRKDIEEFQFKKIKETFSWVNEKSPFYAKLYDGMKLESMEDFRKLPFTTPDDLCEHELEMLCVPQSQISRIVTMETSGTTGQAKRIYFTEADQQLTVDFFHHGMKLIVDETDTMLLLMPCKRPGSIGVLLKEALEKIGVRVIPYGLPNGNDIKDILEIMEQEKVTCTLALAAHLAAIASQADGYNINMRSVLLSADYVSAESRKAINDAWGCKIFEHYGMTEMGLGCAVSCPELEGYHIRENDLYLEIIDPETGQLLPDGEEGEIVFTTLTRKGMPFIRYRTGDRSSYIKEPCACGSVLKRISRVGDRKIKKGDNNG